MVDIVSYRKPERFFVRDEYGPGEVLPWEQVEEALRAAHISEAEWEAGIKEGETALGPYVDVPFLFWWDRQGKFVAGRRKPIEETIGYVVVGFMTCSSGTFTQYFGNQNTAEEARAAAQRKTEEYRKSPYRSSDTSWKYKAAKVVVI